MQNLIFGRKSNVSGSKIITTCMTIKHSFFQVVIKLNEKIQNVISIEEKSNL